MTLGSWLRHKNDPDAIRYKVLDFDWARVRVSAYRDGEWISTIWMERVDVERGFVGVRDRVESIWLNAATVKKLPQQALMEVA